MFFDPNNPIVKLCAKGMEQEGLGEKEKAANLFDEAWRLSMTDHEKLTAAHYVARHQATVEARLSWDITALNHALKIDTADIHDALPSLYLNIGKCYEDMNDFENARLNYLAAKEHLDFLPSGGYGHMIRLGVESGLERIAENPLLKK
ncbi:MAG: hypothetical protein R2813_03795 [Flavobacteriales bacterium]